MPDQMTPADLHGAWTHSHEEDHDGLLVFRPSDWDFPPARGRDSFTLGPQGHLGTRGPGPDDRSVQGTGTWSYDGALNIAPFGSSPQRFAVADVRPDLLVVRRADDDPTEQEASNGPRRERDPDRP